ncbi:NACHT domain-containing protein [Streptomyces muensis]|uniref:AAA+ ATPase domain-containing protein n=1 Tax=Streptomyces muensis TaxID=1077944 RepID=A0A9X1Q6D2_STRM4|nr:hypothetical protein [Streptomyces muensis]MCF1598754.1 hypothetical protein [Streptomyces muensis]
MAAPPAGPVADFCAELRRLVRACAVPQAEIAQALGRGNSSISELLNGRRRTAPDWEAVRHIVALCARRHAPSARPPAGVRIDEGWWRSRHAELERTVERARTTPSPGPGPEPEPQPQPDDHRPFAPAPAAYSPGLDAAGCMGMGTEQAVYLLADGRPELMYEWDRILHPLDGDGRPPYVLDSLLDGFPQRVRAAHGLARSALLWAAQVVLAAALIQCVDRLSQLGALDFVRLLTRSALQVPGRPEGLSPAGHPPPLPPGEPASDTPERRARYDHCVRLVGELAADCPEFALTTAPLGTVVRDTADGPDGTGLAGLEALLAEYAGRDKPFAAGRARLRDPIASLESSGPRLPSLERGYVNPRFRVADQERRDGAEHGVTSNKWVASDKWWEQQPSYDTIEHFFAAYLLGLPALLTPLVVLGHPGAGKSLLTKLLTARLPADEFRPLRVELRYTPAEADVQTQLEHALRQATGRRVSWPDWSEAEPGVVPVVLLDGFDELLQAGAQRLAPARQWGYLREVARFQEREAELGRPLVVIVTSRTVVADRAEIPRTSQVLRLEPFGEQEIERWLSIWNTANADYLDRGGLRPLASSAVLPHRELAAQPLLLLMLALYDSVGNALHRLRDEDISRTGLYERLLTEFVRRQLDKDGPLPPAEVGAAVERELHRLSVIALGMFHRGVQAISAEEADRDLRALGAPADHGRGLLFGRFFFVHEAQAVVTEERLRSYEFLHATFGEHLAARLIERALRGLAPGQAAADDGELYALLSFTPLTDRAQLVHNLRDMLAAWPEEGSSAELVEALIGLFRAAAWGGPEGRTDVAYVPVRQTRAYRDAVYEANLLLITVLAAGKVYASQLLELEGDVAAGWRRHAMAWQAQMSTESWDLLCSTLNLDRRPRPGPDGSYKQGPDLVIGTDFEPLGQHELGWPRLPMTSPHSSTGDAASVIRRVMFTADGDAELLLHTSYPLLVQVPGAVAWDQRDTRNMAQTLVALLIRDTDDPLSVPDRYVMCLDRAGRLGIDERLSFLEALLRQLVHDAPAMSDEDLGHVLSRLFLTVTRHSGVSTAAIRQPVLRCLGDALERGSSMLTERLNSFRRLFVEPDRVSEAHRSISLNDLRDLVRLSHSTHIWRWACSLRGDAAARHLDGVLTDLDLRQVAATDAAVLVGLLRLAVELDLGDWLSAHAAEILAALPPEAFGLLRPSDLRPLRAALPKGAYDAEFREVEWVWRGPTPPVGTPAPRSPAP